MRPEFQTPDFSIYCRTWIDALNTIYEAIPTFATWRIDSLAELFGRYRTILAQVSENPVMYRKCDPLTKNLGLIESTILEARSDRSWLPFNRAALEMGWDIEILRGILEMHTGG